MYLLYLVLSFTEVLVLFASAIGLLVFIVREIVRAIEGLLDAAMNAISASKQPRIESLQPLGVGGKGRVRIIPGGHNEHF